MLFPCASDQPSLKNGALVEPMHWRQSLPVRGGCAAAHRWQLQRALCSAVSWLQGGHLPSAGGCHLPRTHPQHLPAAERRGICGSPWSWSWLQCCPCSWGLTRLWWCQMGTGIPHWNLQTMLNPVRAAAERRTSRRWQAGCRYVAELQGTALRKGWAFGAAIKCTCRCSDLLKNLFTSFSDYPSWFSFLNAFLPF